MGRAWEVLDTCISSVSTSSRPCAKHVTLHLLGIGLQQLNPLVPVVLVLYSMTNARYSETFLLHVLHEDVSCQPLRNRYSSRFTCFRTMVRAHANSYKFTHQFMKVHSLPGVKKREEITRYSPRNNPGTQLDPKSLLPPVNHPDHSAYSKKRFNKSCEHATAQKWVVTTLTTRGSEDRHGGTAN